MTSLVRTVTAIVILTALAAAAGGWFGIQYGLHETRSSGGLDELVHRELHLTADQDQRLSALESQFAIRRKTLDGEMRAANRDLATAIVSEHHYGPSAQHAIERFHMASRTLQEETIMHVLAMRAVLTPEQAKQFDDAVSRALVSDQP